MGMWFCKKMKACLGIGMLSQLIHKYHQDVIIIKTKTCYPWNIWIVEIHYLHRRAKKRGCGDIYLMKWRPEGRNCDGLSLVSFLLELLATMKDAHLQKTPPGSLIETEIHGNSMLSKVKTFVTQVLWHRLTRYTDQSQNFFMLAYLSVNNSDDED